MVRIELHTKDLKGLSYRDLELANIIDSFDLEKYQLVPLAKEKGYKTIIRNLKLDEDAQTAFDEIANMAPPALRNNKFR